MDSMFCKISHYENMLLSTEMFSVAIREGSLIEVLRCKVLECLVTALTLVVLSESRLPQARSHQNLRIAIEAGFPGPETSSAAQGG